MDYLYLMAALCGFIIVLCTADILLRLLVPPEQIERIAERIFRV